MEEVPLLLRVALGVGRVERAAGEGGGGVGEPVARRRLQLAVDAGWVQYCAPGNQFNTLYISTKIFMKIFTKPKFEKETYTNFSYP